MSWCDAGGPCCASEDNLAAAGLTEHQWRQHWESARLFLTADGEKDQAWGNETIRRHPDLGWLEIKLPAPLARLANRPHGRYRLSARSSSPTEAMRSRPKPPRERCAMTSVMTPHRAAGISTRRWKAPHRSLRIAAPVAAAPGCRGRREPRSPRQWPSSRPTATSWHPRHHPAGPGRAAVGHPRRAAARRHQRADQPPPGSTAARAIVIEYLDFAATRDRRTRTGRQPSLARPTRPRVPADGDRHPHRQVPRPAGPDGIECRACR